METQQADATLTRPLVLVGLMGVGKTTIGKRLAARLHLPFADADAEIESAAGMSVSEIFERHGEPAFRDGERRVIQRLVTGEPLVLATGGGAFVNAQTRALILERGIAVWLKADIDTLVERTARRDTRPLLKGGNAREVLTRLLAEREPAYAEAPLHITSGNAPHDVTVNSIVAALKGLA